MRSTHNLHFFRHEIETASSSHRCRTVRAGVQDDHASARLRSLQVQPQWAVHTASPPRLAFFRQHARRSAPRLFVLDDTETLIQWKTKKTGRGDFDAFSLLDIDGIVRGCETRTVRAADEAWRMITIHAPPRRLVMGFETEQRCRMFADGLSLVVAEAQGRAAPQAGRAGASNDSSADAPKENGVQRPRKTRREQGKHGWRF